MQIRATISTHLEDIINQVLIDSNASNTRSYDVIHPSAVGGCIRKMVFESLYLPRTEPTARELRVFDNGHHLHKRIEDYFEKAGVLVARELTLDYPPLNIKGNTDALILINGRYQLVELKSMKDTSWKFMVGKERHPSEMHYIQLQLYMHLIRKLYPQYDVREGYILAENKNDQVWHSYLIEYDENAGKEIEERIDYINKCIVAGKVPDVEYSSGSFPCSWKGGSCGYYSECYG